MHAIVDVIGRHSILKYPCPECREAQCCRGCKVSKYETFSTMHDNDPEVLEREKQRTLSGEHRKTPHIDGAPGWNEHLASTSEAFVKADKHGSTSVDEMQRKTVDYIHTRHSPDDRVGGREATYQRDEVHGPLSDVKGSLDHDDGATLLDYSKTVQKTTVREETIKRGRKPD